MDAKEIAQELDILFHKKTALDWDNCGLLVCPGPKEIRDILVCLDICEAVIDEAIEKKAHLIVSHHPLIFAGFKNLLYTGLAGNNIIRAVKNDISIYCAHTNYDMMEGGLCDKVIQKLGIQDAKPLSPAGKKWFKFVVFVPQAHSEKVREAICQNHGGLLGDYSCCTFNTAGKGTFMPLSGADPFIGEKERLSIVDETKIESIVDEEYLDGLIQAVKEVHPYEEVAYDVYRLENAPDGMGFGRIGTLERAVTFAEMAGMLKDCFHIKNFRFLSGKGKGSEDLKIHKVAFINGSASSLSHAVLQSDADAVVVGETGYHHAVEIAQSGKMLIEIGHYESEKLAIEDMHDTIGKMLADRGFDIGLLKSGSGNLGWRYSVE